MTWEQELRIQSKEIGEKIAQQIAPEIAKDMAKNMATDMAKGMAQDMAKNIAQGMAKDMAQNMAENIAQNIAQTKIDESKIETAKNLLTKDIDPTVIAECTGLPLEQVLQLQKEAQVTLKR